MSIFDPFQLYTHPQHKSHTGQVIRKKPIEIGYAFTEHDLKKGLEIVKNYGFYVSRNPIQPARAMYTYSIKFTNNQLDTIHMITKGQLLSITAPIRNLLLTYYSQIFSADRISTIDIFVSIPVISVKHDVSPDGNVIHFYNAITQKDSTSYTPSNQGPVYSIISSLGNCT